MNDNICLRALWKEAFSDTDDFLDIFFRSAYSPDRCLYLTEGEALTAALYWFDCRWGSEKVAYLYAIATAKAFRGQGLCRRLMAHAHHLLKSQGYAGAVLVPENESLAEMYQKMGYMPLCSRDGFSVSPAEPVCLRELSAEEYRLARRQYLPENGILQEGENLSFLAELTRFYRGEDFLLAVAKENDALLCPELLGNKAAAPGITAALGCKQGQFYAPGGNLPFAMWHGLNTDAMPAYFGHAFE